jgi:hypothetical protein
VTASEQDLQDLVDALLRTWPQTWRQGLSSADHPMSSELLALKNGFTAHLPFFRSSGQTAWLTVAPTATSLRHAIIGLRAWIIPSFGWEDRNNPIIVPGQYSGPLRQPLLEVSPTGYYRWHSLASTAQEIIPLKLRKWRQLQGQNPTFLSAHVPSLFELREQFRLALAIGDRSLAEKAIDAIDDRQLDTAANTLFMRMKMRARFGAYHEITEEPRLMELLALRLPHAVRISIAEAFFEVHLRGITDQKAAERIYDDNVHPLIASLLSVCRVTDGEGVARLLDHYKRTTISVEKVRKTGQDDFFEALRRCDWRSVQESGMALINRGGLSDDLATLIKSNIAEALKFHANPRAMTFLSEHAFVVASPQTWPQFVDLLRSEKFLEARKFFDVEERVSLDPLHNNVARELLSTFQELYTNPGSASEQDQNELLNGALALLVEDLVGDPEYPRGDLGSVYFALFELWTEHRIAHIQTADTNAALALAEGSLRGMETFEVPVAQLLRRWWEARPVRARLPFLMEALDLLSDVTANPADAQGLWIDGVTFIRSYSVTLTPTETTLWRAVGARLGIEADIVQEYLPAQIDSITEQDILAKAGLKRIAIVSLHEKAARNAADIIRSRTEAEVVIDAEIAPGGDTERARTADVILLVWAATKHSVYRHFDDVRDRLAYVQGTGATSIVMALERWALARE